MTNIRDYLRSLPAETICYRPNPGNGGDALIAQATFQLFRECRVRYRVIGPQDDLKDRVLVYGGGGNLVANYRPCSDFVRAHHRDAKKLVLFPHTIDDHEDLLRELGANVDIICRERTSFNHVIRHAGKANVYLMDDLAFNLDVARTFDEIDRHPRFLLDRSSLKESVRLVKQQLRYRSALLKRRRHLKAGESSGPRRLNCFRTDCERTSVEIPPDNVDLSHLFMSPRVTTEYPALIEAWAHVTTHRVLSYMKPFDEIHTNRLHLGIAGILLGQKVYFYPNAYWKNESVYQHSMKGRFTKVTWIAPDRP